MTTSSPDHPFSIDKKALVHEKEIVRRIVPLLTANPSYQIRLISLCTNIKRTVFLPEFHITFRILFHTFHSIQSPIVAPSPHSLGLYYKMDGYVWNPPYLVLRQSLNIPEYALSCHHFSPFGEHWTLDGAQRWMDRSQMSSSVSTNIHTVLSEC